MGTCCGSEKTVAKKTLTIDDITEENLLLLNCLITNFIAKNKDAMAIKLIKIEYLTKAHYSDVAKSRKTMHDNESMLTQCDIDSFHQNLEREMAQVSEAREVLLEKYKEQTKIWFKPNKESLNKFLEEMGYTHQKKIQEIYDEAYRSISNNNTHEIAVRRNKYKEFNRREESFLLDICTVTTHIYTNKTKTIKYSMSRNKSICTVSEEESKLEIPNGIKSKSLPYLRKHSKSF